MPRRLRQLLSLRADGGRLSLEGVLTGVAIWLTLGYVMERPAEAAVPGAGPLDDPGSADAPAGDDPDPPGAVEGHGIPRARAAPPPGVNPREQAPSPGMEAALAITPGPLISGSAARPGMLLRSQAGSPPNDNPLQRSGTTAATGNPLPSGLDAPSIVPPARDMPMAWTGQGSRSEAAAGSPLDEGLDASTAPGQPASPPVPWKGESSPFEPAGRGPSLVPPPAAPPPLPSVVIAVLREAEVVARAVDGPARSQASLDQVGLTGSSLDLSPAVVSQVSIDSVRQARLRADSRLDQAMLSATLTNQGMAASTIRGGTSTSTYRITAKDQLDLGLQAIRAGELQLSDQVVGMAGAHLDDSGGDDAVAIDASLALRISAAVSQGLLNMVLSLGATALLDSIIRLGSGDNRVSISSRVAPEVTIQPLAEPASDTSGAEQAKGEEQGNGSPGWRLEARSYGLRNSLLDTGDGNDAVRIIASSSTARNEAAPATTDERTDREPEAVALEDSVLNLGGGDDHLQVEGALLRSRLDVGPGQKWIAINGAVVDGALLLSPGSSSQVQLGHEGNRLRIQGEAQLHLDSGSGDDRFVVDGTLAGSLAAGGGLDLLEARVQPPGSRVGDSPELAPSAGTAPLPPPGEDADSGEAGAKPPTMVLDGPGQGRIGSLGFSGIEAVDLQTRDGVVLIDPSGRLEDRLSTSARGGVLDYGGWSEPVRVNLGLGGATAIAAGANGGLEGFVAVQGGSSDDHLVAGLDTRWLHGGDGEDWLELPSWLPPAASPNDRGTVLRGDGGRDLFVLPDVDGSWPGLALAAARQPSLADLTLVETPGGGLGLSDRLAYWQRPGACVPASGALAGPAPATLLEPDPSGAEGVGDIRCLPIAPLEQLLAGIGTTTPQLAIAAGTGGSALVLLGPGHTCQELASLPSLHLPDHAAEAAGAV